MPTETPPAPVEHEALAWWERALSHAALGNIAEAEQALLETEARSTGHIHAVAACARGGLYSRQKRWAAAVAPFTDSLRTGFDVDTLVALALCYFELGAYRPARAAFQHAAAVAPNHEGARAGLAACGAQLAAPPPPPPAPNAPVVDEFHRAWYATAKWAQLEWFGVPMSKNPFDLVQYQEIFWQQRPDVVIESGAFLGGSTLYFAHMLDILGHGELISIEIEDSWLPAARQHPRVTTIAGDSVAPATVAAVRARVPDGANCFVILDSNHRADHVLKELRAYAPLVHIGNYVIVEDGNVNGHPILPEYGPGPYEAAEAFLAENPAFVADREREAKLLITCAPLGWLKRIA